MKSAISLLLACVLCASAARAIGPLQISANGRHLVDEQGQPFLMTGDSAWSLFAQISLAEAQLYLQDRADRGFNAVIASLIEHAFAANAPANDYGDPPFTGKPFATPNEAYFAHCDAVMDFAAQKGIVIFLSPVYLGWQCSDQGWCAEVAAATQSEMRSWGNYVANRYGGYDNLVWVIGGDTDPTPVASKVRAFVEGLLEVDDTHLVTAHNQRGTEAITYWANEDWLNVNNVFAQRNALYQYTQAAYLANPDMPFFLIEGFYEHMSSATNQQLRAQSYWTVLTGGFGLLFGNCPLWHFGYSWEWCALIDWQGQLALPGSVQMTHYRALFESRRWEKLVPDTAGALILSGKGTFGQEDYATAAKASDGSSIIAYVPTPRAMQIDTSGLSGVTVRAWWYNPANGTAQLIGNSPKGTTSIAAVASGDRVLVLDDAAQSFAEPGTPLPTATPTARVAQVELLPNRPNPFNPSTEIHYRLHASGTIRISIFDAGGRRVRVLADAPQEIGEHWLRWDGRDEQGVALASGVYLCQIESEDGAVARKMVLVK